MDRLPGPAGGPQSPLHPPSPSTSTDEARAELVRIVHLVAGQRLQGTVVAISGPGTVLLGLMGGVVEATTGLELEVGRSYEFTVASTQPRIVLSTARPLFLPGFRGAVAAGFLGPPSPPGLDLIAEALTRLGPPAAKTASEAGSTLDQLGSALANLEAETPSAADLQTIQRLLGHDQEARVLRLESGKKTRRAQVEVLQHTLKADALRMLAQVDSAARPPRKESVARELVSGLNAIEFDNAKRSEQGVPQWLPLPVAEYGPLRDARMFVLGGEGSHEGDDDGDGQRRPFTVVLLLDFTRLGQVRVDLQLRGSELSATFVAVESSTVHSLVAGMRALRERLETGGLEVRALTVRSAPSQLPVADLVMRPPDSTSMVDVHA